MGRRRSKHEDNGMQEALALYQIFSQAQNQQKAQEDDLLKLLMSQQQFQQQQDATGADREATRALTERQLDQQSEANKALDLYRQQTVKVQYDPMTHQMIQTTQGDGPAQAYVRQTLPEVAKASLNDTWLKLKADYADDATINNGPGGQEGAALLSKWAGQSGGEFNLNWLYDEADARRDAAKVNPVVPLTPAPVAPVVNARPVTNESYARDWFSKLPDNIALAGRDFLGPYLDPFLGSWDLPTSKSGPLPSDLWRAFTGQNQTQSGW